MRDAAETLMHDPVFAPHILEPLDVFGVDSWEPGTLFLKARIKTVPLKQFLVGRELRKRMALIFTDRRIPVPVPQLQVTIDGDGEALWAMVLGLRGANARTVVDGVKAKLEKAA